MKFKIVPGRSQRMRIIPVCFRINRRLIRAARSWRSVGQPICSRLWHIGICFNHCTRGNRGFKKQTSLCHKKKAIGKKRIYQSRGVIQVLIKNGRWVRNEAETTSQNHCLFNLSSSLCALLSWEKVGSRYGLGTSAYCPFVSPEWTIWLTMVRSLPEMLVCARSFTAAMTCALQCNNEQKRKAAESNENNKKYQICRTDKQILHTITEAIK